MPHEKKLRRLLHVIGLMDARCPVDRHELADMDWMLLGSILKERAIIEQEEAKKAERSSE